VQNYYEKYFYYSTLQISYLHEDDFSELMSDGVKDLLGLAARLDVETELGDVLQDGEDAGVPPREIQRQFAEVGHAQIEDGNVIRAIL